MATTIKRARNREDLEDKRQDLLSGALAVISRKGLSGITINDIALEVGCSYGVVNFHFKTKERLLLAALDVLQQEYERTWEQMLYRAKPMPADQLRAIIALDFGSSIATKRNIAIWTAFWAEASRVPAYRAICSDLKRRSLSKITFLITELAAGSELGMSPELIAYGLYAMSDGCWIYGQVTGECGPEYRQQSRELCFGYLARFFPEHFSEDVAPAMPGDILKTKRSKTSAT